MSECGFFVLPNGFHSPEHVEIVKNTIEIAKNTVVRWLCSSRTRQIAKTASRGATVDFDEHSAFNTREGVNDGDS